MKRHTSYFVALLTFSLGVSAHPSFPAIGINSQQTEPTSSPVGPRCAEGAFTVEDQPEALVRLVIVNAICDGPHWTSRLTLENVSGKVIVAYKVANIDTYQYKRGGESSQGVTGMSLQPGEVRNLDMGGGYRNGMSYGKPTGPVRKNLFWIKHILYADGTEWRHAEQER